ncbi:MAG TPA: polysaccharide deacetylase family protein [Propionicimonas sp.]
MSTRRLLAMLVGAVVLAGLAPQLPAQPTAPDVVHVAQPLAAAKPPARTLLPVDGTLPDPPAAATPDPSSPGNPPVKAGRPDCSKLKCVALTMDDGPVPGTAHVLDLLKRKGVHATFFVLGQLASRHPALLRRMVAEGHVIGNHSWNHPEFFGKTVKAIRSQLVHTDAAVHRATGHDPVLMRPPFGEVTAKVRTACRRLGDAVVLWDVDPLDWKDRKASTVAHRVVKQAKRGSIILTHDSLKTTRAAYADIIDGLRARGFTLVTVPELFGGRLVAGRVYLRG